MRTNPFRSLPAGWLCLAAASVALAESPDALRWRHYANPVFPPALLSTTVRSGFATVVFTFDDDGRITDRIVLSASHPEFAEAVKDAAREWTVETAPLARLVRRETLRFDFELHGSIVSMTHRDATQAVFEPEGGLAAGTPHTCRESELGSSLETIARALPERPAPLQGVGGIATVNFVVDEDGQVRVPAVTGASRAEFAEAALGAIRQWRFRPPRQKGAPVQVTVERTFRFGAAGDRN
jgi:TonB family protein